MLLLAAAIVSVITFFVHTFVGGKFVARPLLADTQLPKASKWLNYYCWHITTITIVFLAAAFAGMYLSVFPAELRLLIFLATFTSSLSALSIFVALKGGIHPLRFPSTSLFALIAVCTWLAAFFEPSNLTETAALNH